MENLTALESSISNIGFPIFMCLILVFAFKYALDKVFLKIETMEESREKQSEAVSQALNKTTEALNNNTVAFTKLYERLCKNESND